MTGGHFGRINSVRSNQPWTHTTQTWAMIYQLLIFSLKLQLKPHHWLLDMRWQFLQNFTNNRFLLELNRPLFSIHSSFYSNHLFIGNLDTHALFLTLETRLNLCILPTPNIFTKVEITIALQWICFCPYEKKRLKHGGVITDLRKSTGEIQYIWMTIGRELR